MTAVYKRELRSYFSSPIGYVCVGALIALYGFFSFLVMAQGYSSNINQIYSMMFSFSLMVIPIITMKSMAEDRKNKTDQALLTAPVGVTSIVIGKFLASFSVFFIASTLGLLPMFAIAAYSAQMPWGMLLGNYIGTLMYGGAMISIGVFISSITVSQIIAAVGTFAISVILMYIDGIASAIQNKTVSAIIGWISFSSRYSTFIQGLFNIPSVVFFLSVAAIFVFLTARRLESRRWS